MNAENFVYWLKGYLELSEPIDKNPSLTVEQVQVIKDHIELVLKKENLKKLSGKPLFDFSNIPGSTGILYDYKWNTSC